jgi:plastocyanin
MDRRSFLGSAGLLALVGSAGCICGYSASAAGDDEDGDPSGQPTETTAPPTTPATTAASPTTSSPTTPRTTTPPRTTTDATTTTVTGTETPPSSSTPTATPTPTSTATPTPTATPPPSSVTVAVGEDGLFFAPRTFELAVGGTVEWVWVGNGHNVKPDGIPDDSGWSGTPGGPRRTYDEGYSYSRTFDVAGEYAYTCTVHEQYGMGGSFVVR